MKKNLLFLMGIALIFSGCGVAPKKPSDALSGHWINTQNFDTDYYFSEKGEITHVSPIGDYFIGKYIIEKEDPKDRTLELKIVDKVPGQEKSHTRRFSGEFSEDYKKFSGKSLTAAKLPFIFEYVDNQQVLEDAEVKQLLKDFYKTREELEETRKNLRSAYEKIRKVESDYLARAKEQQTQIEELRLQVKEFQTQMKEMGIQPQIGELQYQINELQTQIEKLATQPRDQDKLIEETETK